MFFKDNANNACLLHIITECRTELPVSATWKEDRGQKKKKAPLKLHQPPWNWGQSPFSHFCLKRYNTENLLFKQCLSVFPRCFWLFLSVFPRLTVPFCSLITLKTTATTATQRWMWNWLFNFIIHSQSTVISLWTVFRIDSKCAFWIIFLLKFKIFLT